MQSNISELAEIVVSLARLVFYSTGAMCFLAVPPLTKLIVEMLARVSCLLEDLLELAKLALRRRQ